MKMRRATYLFAVLLLSARVNAQLACPVNSDFSLGTLTHWGAYLGNNQGGNGKGAIMQTFDTAKGAPGGTIGVQSINEYQAAFQTGIQVQTTSRKDTFGGFATVPTIGGYRYASSIKLGST